MNPTTDRKELASWKEVAAYLGVTLRTAQLWEKERGLPIRRLPGGRGRVAAYLDELEKWKEARPMASEAPKKLPWHWVAIAGGALLLAVVASLSLFNRPQPVSTKIDGDAFVVYDATGRELWRKLFPEMEHRPLNVHRSWIGDLDGDGRREVLFATDHQIHSELLCFSGSGELKWRFVPGRKMETRREKFNASYVVEGFSVLADRRIVVTSRHFLDYPSQVALLSASGKMASDYWHSGQLNLLSVADLNHDGKSEIYLGGIANGYKQAVVVQLDPDNLGGASHEENADFQLLGMSEGTERHRILLPRSCVNRQTLEYNMVAGVRALEDRIMVSVREAHGENGFGADYAFGPELKLLSAKWSDQLRPRHDELRRQRVLDHDLSEAELQAVNFPRVLK